MTYEPATSRDDVPDIDALTERLRSESSEIAQRAAERRKQIGNGTADHISGVQSAQPLGNAQSDPGASVPLKTPRIPPMKGWRDRFTQAFRIFASKGKEVAPTNPRNDASPLRSAAPAANSVPQRKLGLPPELEEDSPLMEACRTLRVNLVPGQMDSPPPPLLLIGPAPRTGSSLVAAGLGAVLAEEGHSTLLIDADMRQSTFDGLFRLNSSPGLAELLQGDVENVPTTQVDEKLWILPAGKVTGAASELFRLGSVGTILGSLASQFDTVVYHIAHQRLQSDALLLAPHIGAVVLAIRAGVDTAEEIQRMKASLERNGVEILGFVMLDN